MQDESTIVRVPLTRGIFALIDEADADLVLSMKWQASPGKLGTFYATHNRWLPEIRSVRKLMLHNLLMQPPAGLFVDHRNHNGIDCRRSNMRLCTRSQNQANARYASKTGFRGVYAIGVGRYLAVLQKRRLGTFATPEDAARAWDQSARVLHGEFALLNFPD